MKRFLIAATLSLALCACAAGQARGRDPLKPVANPSAVIAAELAFARLAQEKGQWAAFRATAAKGAEMFVPQRVRAADWLKGRAEPAQAVKWQPHAVWSSCDGSYAVTRGGWTSGKGAGFFNTVWKRQEDGGYKWVLDMGDDAQAQSTPPEMIAAKVATCMKPGTMAIEQSDPETGIFTGWSNDKTLIWTAQVQPDGKHRFIVQTWNGQDMDTVLDTAAPAGAPR